jgi:hypothetical protein
VTRLLVAAAVWLAACDRPAPPSPFRCDAHTCDARTHYCEQIKTDVPALPSTFTCKPLPASCRPAAGPDCGCFAAGTRCRTFCRRVDTAGVTGFQLICVGGA